ncbi:MIT domain-containing protein 1-like [Stomoxys calcitrans]|uniref:MIT domain-containing protein 1-like n=1 Tax=Stomoxys calcitrans TaxID=35570 RepID=UPI0027E36E09|nr:MIT domain-containing protein 1-like [Stomoxys calcitrans]
MDDVSKILSKALECDASDRILEAGTLYDKGLHHLKQLIAATKNTRIAKKYLEHMSQYKERSKKIQLSIKKLLEEGTVLQNISISQNSMGHSYESLFGQYLKSDIEEIYLEEPYLHRFYQYENLIVFFELAARKCPNLRFIKLITKRMENANILNDIRNDLRSRHIGLHTSIDEFLHDRKIALSNGVIIKIGRGLHFFKAVRGEYALGQFDYDYRECLKTDVDIWTSAKTMGG